MDAPTILGTAGLLLDILGVALLLAYTSMRTIEAELSYKMVLESTDEGGEWLQPYSFKEHMARLERTRIRVAKNRRRARFGLGCVGVGFALQAVALWL